MRCRGTGKRHSQSLSMSVKEYVLLSVCMCMSSIFLLWKRERASGERCSNSQSISASLLQINGFFFFCRAGGKLPFGHVNTQILYFSMRGACCRLSSSALLQSVRSGSVLSNSFIILQVHPLSYPSGDGALTHCPVCNELLS